NNSIFTFGHADRAKTSASFREILDAMWLFENKFERALSKLKEIKARKNGYPNFTGSIRRVRPRQCWINEAYSLRSPQVMTARWSDDVSAMKDGYAPQERGLDPTRKFQP